MSLMTDEEMTALQQQRVPWEATCRAIEALAHERGKQQGLAEAVEIALSDSSVRGNGIALAIKFHATKELK